MKRSPVDWLKPFREPRFWVIVLFGAFVYALLMIIAFRIDGFIFHDFIVRFRAHFGVMKVLVSSLSSFFPWSCTTAVSTAVAVFSQEYPS